MLNGRWLVESHRRCSEAGRREWGSRRIGSDVLPLEATGNLMPGEACIPLRTRIVKRRWNEFANTQTSRSMGTILSTACIEVQVVQQKADDLSTDLEPCGS